WEITYIKLKLQPDGTFLDPSFTGYGSGFLTFFSEERNGHYRPRSLFVDLEPYALNKVTTGSHGSLFGQKAMISRSEASGCNSGRAYNLGRELMEPVMDRIRLLLEDCSNCQAFLLFRSIAGGTGSGLSQILLDHLTSEYGEKTKFEFCVYPTAKLTSSALETYNSVIIIHQSLDQIDCSFIFENEKVY
ncbi:alpha-tubulin, partial [Flagelloscypha sp. PMI_526]